jgi:hypothetical protein
MPLAEEMRGGWRFANPELFLRESEAALHSTSKL